ncbi:MAG TPA: multicopper oxidase domain-containing protein [Gemmatimonadaceae bacterium]|nr:multicopper oxidase domain-containing protein [Gemmatimonadaceae bacterium]
MLSLRLEAKDGLWYPEGPDGMARPVAAFSEEGGPLQNPGPLIRVSVGVEVRVTVRNSLGVPLTMFGLGERRGVEADSFRIDPGGVHEARFMAAVPGTYYYAGKTTSVPRLFARGGPDSQLNGVIVVDPIGAPDPARDRIFVMSLWGRVDTTSPSGVGRGALMTVNGLSWPHTERFDVAQGDSLRWRWVNMTPPPHPMHLHGFYFRVDAKGDGAQDTAYSPRQQRLAVTEVLRAGETMAISWSPERPGNWIFHCHIARHIVAEPAPESEKAMFGMRHAARVGNGDHHVHAMAKLVLGIRVKPRGELRRSSGEPRPIRLLVRSRPSPDGGHARYGYVLGGSAEETEPAATPIPGPTLVLEKDQPVAITVVNQSHEPAAVHWHGVELESFPDGVPGWSGDEKGVLPVIQPRDSLTVRFTPPRAGTFMYHSHFNEMQQISSGLYGSIIVLEPGKRHDPETDRVLLFSDAGPTINTVVGPFAPALLNGRARPDPIELRVGVKYRLRLINIRSDYPVSVALMDGQAAVEWRHIAKDGATLPTAQMVNRRAQLTFGPGEIYDVEFTPRAAGELRLLFGFPPRFRPNVSVPESAVVAVRVR